jgi:hypothetical protein
VAPPDFALPVQIGTDERKQGGAASAAAKQLHLKFHGPPRPGPARPADLGKARACARVASADVIRGFVGLVFDGDPTMSTAIKISWTNQHHLDHTHLSARLMVANAPFHEHHIKRRIYG